MTRFCLHAFIPRRWRLRDIRRVRLTRWLLLAGMLVMLGMQTALAAYACAMPAASGGPKMAMSASANDTSMPASCAAMSSTVANRPLCEKHCAPDAYAPTAAHPLSVPPNLLGSLPPSPPAVAMQTRVAVATDARHRLHPPGPPAALLFCSLLI